ncbi:MAG TPA: 5'-nucleotidase C-terminal domain-containing protein [Myxococcaceae bacterium]|jgi:2',3'-cyclic-nucleotide 2'-phosphodiesterase (5'-nucleotidase family)
MRLPRLALVAAAWGGLSACISFNEPCSGVAENPNEQVAYLNGVVYLDKANARHANNAIGQGAAEAFLDATETGVPPSDFAVINGGGLRGEGLCVPRTILPTGGLKSGVLHEIMLFENRLLSLRVTRDELRALIEASVTRLTPEGLPIVNPPGEFLHIAGGTEQINCANPPGSRVTRLVVGGEDMLLAGPDVRLAITDFNVYTGTGTKEVFAAMTGGVSSRDVHTYDLTDAQVVERYFKKSYQPPQGQTFPSLSVDGRIELVGCATPGPPTK